MYLHTTSLALLLVAAFLLPPDARSAEQPEPESKLSQAIDALWKEGDIASDAEYVKLSQPPVADAPSPRDLRRVVLDWPQPRQMRGSARQRGINFEHDRLTLSWWSEISSGLEAVVARDRFAGELTKLGYRPLDKKELAVWEKDGGRKVTEWGGVYLRKSGGSELLVWFEALPYTGSSTYYSGTSYQWQIRRPNQGPQPELVEAVEASPPWVKANYLREKLYAKLADQRVTWLSGGESGEKGMGIGFAEPIAEKLIATLEQNGFEHYREESPGRDGTVQKTWYRYSDATYAHVIVSADGKLRFSCQAPQHTGKPRQGKPPALHPSLKLPREKRPIVAFDRLVFADLELKRQATLFHDLAEKLAQKDWHVQRYKDSRHSSEPRYTGLWGTSEVRSGYPAKVRPCQGMSISLAGTHADGVDRLSTLNAAGTFVPLEGWGATVSYSVSSAGIAGPSLRAAVGYANEREFFSFDGSWRQRQLPLTQHYVSAEAEETDQFHYRFYAQTEDPEFESSLRILSGTPEELRDGVLADLAELRKVAQEQVESGATTSVYDMTDVRSDNPPQELPSSTRPPNVKTKQAFLDEVDKQLDTREQLVRDHFREIHAAVQRALPMTTLRKELSVK